MNFISSFTDTAGDMGLPIKAMGDERSAPGSTAAVVASGLD